MTIADMKLHDVDHTGQEIKIIFGYKPPEYAVYATDRRLTVRYADDPVLASEQRKGAAPLNPVRGEINGLVDGWRTSRFPGLRARAARYDRGVADALVVALEHDVESASIILKQIKQDITDDRTSWARLEYLSASLFLCVLLATTFRWWHVRDLAYDLAIAAVAGAFGAFFSIALNIRSRTILPDLRRTSNITDAALRIIIGFIGASVLIALVRAKVVTVGLGAPISADPTTPWLVTIIIGFLAGFSERLVPDLLAKAGTTTPPTPPPAEALPAAEAGREAVKEAGRASAAGGAPAAGATGDGTTPSADGTAQPVDEASSTEAAVDHCVCDIEIETEETTQDTELPAASGGVEPAETERAA